MFDFETVFWISHSDAIEAVIIGSAVLLFSLAIIGRRR